MIALVTPTGARPEPFNICSKLMERQTYSGKVLWVIVDDANPITTDVVTPEFRDGWEIIKLYPEPLWSPGMNTQSRNMRVGVTEAFDNPDVTAVFIIEDDDYYKPMYLDEMMKRLNGYWAIGETNTIYYNVSNRTVVQNNNLKHSSLFQTALTREALPYMAESYDDNWIDSGFWSRTPKNKVSLISANNLSVGIKGMPGRGGIGNGHKENRGCPTDVSLNYLTKLIGHEDTELYARYYLDNRLIQHEIPTKKRRRIVKAIPPGYPNANHRRIR